MATSFIRSFLTTQRTFSSVLSRSYASISFSTRPFSVSTTYTSFLLRYRPLAAVPFNFNRVSSSAFRSFSTRQTSSSLNDPNPNLSNRPPKETILLDGCDFEHWLVVMESPKGDPTRDEIIDSYVKTLAMVVGSEEEARMKLYSVSTRHYFAFGALVSEELSYKIKELPGVRWVLPDSYLDVRNKDYGGEPVIDGNAVPYDPKYHEEWVRNNARANERNRRNDRPRNFDRSRNFDRRRQNMQDNNMGGAPPPNMSGPGGSMGGAPPPPNMSGPGGNMGGAPLPPNMSGPGVNMGGAPPPPPNMSGPGGSMRAAPPPPPNMSGPGGNMGGAPPNNMPPPQFNNNMGGGGGIHNHGGGMPQNNIGQAGPNYTGGGMPPNGPNYRGMPPNGQYRNEPNYGGMPPPQYRDYQQQPPPQYRDYQQQPPPPNNYVPNRSDGNHQYEQQPNNYTPSRSPYNQQPNYAPNRSSEGNQYNNQQQQHQQDVPGRDGPPTNYH